MSATEENAITELFTVIDNYGTDTEARIGIRRLLAEARKDELGKVYISDDDIMVDLTEYNEEGGTEESIHLTIEERIAELAALGGKSDE